MATADRLSNDTQTEIEEFVDKCLIEDDLPGLSLALVSADGIVYGNGFGARDLSTNRPMTLDTLFGIGSCTKSFTALAILQLAEMGALDVNEPVDEYVDIYDNIPGEPITIHDLLCHGSGMPSDATAVALITRYVTGESATTPLSDANDFKRHVRSSLGTRAINREDPFFYYNSGYSILGDVIEAASDQTYHQYVQTEILDPLGMNRSTFDEYAAVDDDDAATGYYEDDGSLAEGPFPHDRVIDAAGGLMSSVREMTSYLRAQINRGTFEGETILSADSVATMHEPYTTRETRIEGNVQEYGYGWMLQEFLDDRLVEHGGTIAVSTGYIGFLEDAGLGVVIGCNTAPSIHPMYIGPAILALAMGETTTDVPFFALREKAMQVEGEYKSHRELFEASVERTGATLTLSAGGQEYGLLPRSGDPDDLTFETITPSGARAPVEFERYNESLDLFFQRWRLHQTK